MKNKLNSKSLLTAYYLIFSVSAIAFFIMLALTDGESFSITLFRNSVGSDFFMDFFNSIRDAGSKDVYKEGIIYPPLANIFFYVLSLMIDPDLVATPFSNRSMLQKDYVCLFLYFLFVILTLMMFVSMIKRYLKSHNLERFSPVIPIMLVFSYPMIYCVQRGNIALLSLVFSMFFVFFRNSENKWLREFSYILLAIAAGIKIYPAVFGLLLLTDKKFKDALRLVLYGIICFVVPFFFYDGFESIGDLLTNLSAFSDLSQNKLSPAFVCIDVLAMYISMLVDINYASVYNFLFTVVMLSAVIVLILAPKEWQKVWAAAYFVMNFPSSARTYILIFAIIPFIMFVCSEKFRRRDIPYYVAFILMLVVIPPVYYLKLEEISAWITQHFMSFGELLTKNLEYIASPNQIMSAFVIAGMTMYMFVDVLIGIARNEIKIFTKDKSADSDKNLTKTESVVSPK